MPATIFKNEHGMPNERMAAASGAAQKAAKALAVEVRKLAALSLQDAALEPGDCRTPKELEDTEALYMAIMMMANALEMDSDDSAFIALAVSLGSGLANTHENVFAAAQTVGKVGTHALTIFGEIMARESSGGNA